MKEDSMPGNSNRIKRALFYFLMPIIISAIYLFVLFSTLKEAIVPVIGLLILSYFISPFGKEVLIPTAIIGLLDLGSRASPAYVITLVATSVIFVDVMCSLFLIWNLHWIKKIPKIGGAVKAFEDLGRKRLRSRPGRKQLAVLGLSSYVALPFQGSGGIVSTIIGLMAGMGKKAVFLSVFAGSLVGCFAIAVPAYYVGEQMLDIFGSAVWYIMGSLVLLALVVFLINRYLKNRKKNNAKTEKQGT